MTTNFARYKYATYLLLKMAMAVVLGVLLADAVNNALRETIIQATSITPSGIQITLGLLVLAVGVVLLVSVSKRSQVRLTVANILIDVSSNILLRFGTCLCLSGLFTLNLY